MGAAIEPLLDTAAELPGRWPALDDALALVDALRVGTARDREVAGGLLASRIAALHGDSPLSVLEPGPG